MSVGNRMQPCRTLMAPHRDSDAYQILIRVLIFYITHHILVSAGAALNNSRGAAVRLGACRSLRVPRILIVEIVFFGSRNKIEISDPKGILANMHTCTIVYQCTKEITLFSCTCELAFELGARAYFLLLFIKCSDRPCRNRQTRSIMFAIDLNA